MAPRRALIAIVGRPNVGKSTLFNRVIGRRLAFVEDTPGITRDRHFADADLYDRPVTWIDTGGFVPEGKQDVIETQVRAQAQLAVEECDLVVFVVDGRAGVTAGDEDVARYLRRQKRPLLLVVNKADGRKNEDLLVADFHRLGLGTPIPLSAEHGNNIDELKEQALAKLPVLEAPSPAAAAEDEADQFEGAVAGEEEELADVVVEPVKIRGDNPNRPIRVAIVGRPNVGKSTLVNALCGEERMIASPIAGTTRDPVDTEIGWAGRRVILTDTAGIRRKATISQRVEQFSVLGAMRAMEDADVVVLVLDATEAGVDQDQKIAAVAAEKGKALLLVVNKWDLVRGTAREEAFRTELKWYLKWVAWAPMVFVSAKEKLKVTKVLDLSIELYQQQYFRASTPILNRILDHVQTEHPVPWAKGKALRLYYTMQVGTAPLAFAFVCNMPTEVPDRYQRYIINYLRDTFRLKVPVRLFFRERPGRRKRQERVQTFKNREASKSRKRG
jgi:GTP-binding protein